MESVIGIKWSSRSGRFDMAIHQFSLNFKVKSQWQLQRKAIEKFKLECQDDEKLVLEQALSLCYDQCRKHWIIYLHVSSLLSSFSFLFFFVCEPTFLYIHKGRLFLFLTPLMTVFYLLCLIFFC
jgi:hypothetical protein